MNHKVNSVQSLYDDSVSLYNSVVNTTANNIINDLNQGIENLKNTWQGKDAGVQIQNVINVHNALVGIRNALGQIAVDCSKIASNYREIQNANGAGLEAFGPIACEAMSTLAAYSDNRDTVSINQEANNGKAKIDNATNTIDEFISKARSSYDAIINNWTAGSGRDNAISVFEQFFNTANQYKQTLSQVSQSIAAAIQNYTF